MARMPALGMGAWGGVSGRGRLPPLTNPSCPAGMTPRRMSLFTR